MLTKLPEKWFVKPMTSEECKIVGRWFDKNRSGWGCDNGPNFYENGTYQGMEMSNNYGFGVRAGALEITFDQFKQWVLGEEQFETGKWYSFNWTIPSKENNTVICKIKNICYDSVIISWRKYLWDNTTSNSDGYFFKDCYNIKQLSIQEIQQYLPERHPDKIPVKEELNKCSIINLKQNGTDQNERSKIEINLEANTGAEGGKDVRPRTKSVRNICESGSIESGNEVNRARKHRKRIIPEQGETYL